MAEAGAFLEEFGEEERSKLTPLRFGVCVGRFYEDLALRLLAGARQGFSLAGVAEDSVTYTSVPGAFELPFAAKVFAEEGFDGVACLGVVIRGETDHYDFVCAEAARGIQEVQLRPASPARSASSPATTWTRRWPAPAATSATRAATPPSPIARMALLKRQIG